MWWALVAVLFALVELGCQAREAHSDADTFADSMVVSAEVSPVDADTGLVDLTYTNPVDNSTVHAAVLTLGVTSPPHGRIDVEVSRTDPDAVRIEEEARGYSEELPFLVVLVALPLVCVGLRRTHVRRLERLMGSEQDTFAMLGAVAAPHGVQRRWRIFLYPLDAKASADPVCAVELIWLPTLPDGAFPVEVKGEPRPFGLVALRCGNDEVLWPRARSLAARASFPRPGRLAEVPPRILDRPTTLEAPQTLVLAQLLRASAVALLLIFVAMTHAEAWDVEQVLEGSRPAVATIIDEGPEQAFTGSVSVEFTANGSTIRAPLGVSDLTLGNNDTVSIRYKKSDPSIVWGSSQRGPLDPYRDLAIAAVVFLGVGALAADLTVRRRTLARLGIYELATTGRVEAGTYPRPSR